MSVLKFLFSVVFSIIQSMVGGFVLSKFWEWFINPKFTSAPVLNYLDCIGVMMVANLLLTSVLMAVGQVETLVQDQGKEKKDTLTVAIVRSLAMILIVYPLALLIGFTWHQFIR